MKSIVEYLVKGKIDKDAENRINESIEKIKEYMQSSFYLIDKPGRYSDVEYDFGYDTDGFYIDTKCDSIQVGKDGSLDTENVIDFFTTLVDEYNVKRKKDCPHFRWRNHIGRQIVIARNMQNFKSIEGLPENINKLFISEMTGCQSGQIELGKHNIKTIELYNVGKITLSGTPNVGEITWVGYNSKKPTTTFNCKNMHAD